MSRDNLMALIFFSRVHGKSPVHVTVRGSWPICYMCIMDIHPMRAGDHHSSQDSWASRYASSSSICYRWNDARGACAKSADRMLYSFSKFLWSSLIRIQARTASFSSSNIYIYTSLKSSYARHLAMAFLSWMKQFSSSLCLPTTSISGWSSIWQVVWRPLHVI